MLFLKSLSTAKSTRDIMQIPENNIVNVYSAQIPTELKNILQ